MNKRAEKLKRMCRDFEMLQSKWAEFGAYDTEPDGEFQHALRKAQAGERYVPQSAEQWQLYTTSMNCGKAGHELSEQCGKIVDHILNTRQEDMGDIGTVIDGICWRE